MRDYAGLMADHTVVNLKDDVEDMAPKFGFAPGLESRFARKNLELEKSGLSYYKVAPGYNVPFGHVHSEQEEVYVVVSGNAQAKIGDDVIQLKQWDALRVAPGAWRSFGGGSEGAEIIAFGAPNTDNADVEMEQGFWE
jgi:mannose-6-phosphate isomerase-like protein (cupin superfamily)